VVILGMVDPIASTTHTGPAHGTPTPQALFTNIVTSTPQVSLDSPEATGFANGGTHIRLI